MPDEPRTTRSPRARVDILTAAALAQSSHASEVGITLRTDLQAVLTHAGDLVVQWLEEREHLIETNDHTLSGALTMMTWYLAMTALHGAPPAGRPRGDAPDGR